MPVDFENIARSLKEEGIISRDQLKELLRARTQRPEIPYVFSLEPAPQLLEKWRKDKIISGYDYSRLIEALKPPSKETIKAIRERMTARFKAIDRKGGKHFPIVQGGLPTLGKRRP